MCVCVFYTHASTLYVFTGAKLRIYNQHVERGYPGIEHHIACVAISGVIYGSITFVNPAGEDVLDCPKFSYTCMPLGGVEYFQSNLVDNGYVLAIRRFHPKRDAGTWKCRDRKDSDASHVVSVELKSSRESTLRIQLIVMSHLVGYVTKPQFNETKFLDW